MRRLSNKRMVQERKLRKVEKELIAEGNVHCFFYKHKHASSFDHVIPKGQNASLIDEKKNLVPISEGAHWTLTFGTNNQIKKLPHLKDYLLKMKKLDEAYYKRFMTNHELWEEYE